MRRAAAGVARLGGSKTREDCGAMEAVQQGCSSWTGGEGEGTRGQLRGQASPQQRWEVWECYVQPGVGQDGGGEPRRGLQGGEGGRV